jgi:hypothetical protein
MSTSVVPAFNAESQSYLLTLERELR